MFRAIYLGVRRFFRPVRWWCAKRWGRNPVPTTQCYFLRLGLSFDATANQIEDAYTRLKVQQMPAQAKLLLDEAYAVLGHWAFRELYVLNGRALMRHGLAPTTVWRLRFATLVPNLVSLVFDFCPRP